MTEEIPLYKSALEREQYETMADLYSIIIATENLEKAYIRDAISAEEYSSTCYRLIAQYKTSVQSLGDAFDIGEFIRIYDIRCPAAKHRLVDIAVPATTEHVTSTQTPGGNDAKAVAETVQGFITLMDSIKLSLVAVDQLHPLLGDLLQGISRVKLHGARYEWRDKLKDWLIKLNQMNAHDELKAADARQLMFDLESAHTAFYQCLSQ